MRDNGPMFSATALTFVGLNLGSTRIAIAIESQLGSQAESPKILEESQEKRRFESQATQNRRVSESQV